MRLRNVRGAKEVIGSAEFIVHEPESLKGKWNEFFGNNHSIHIEIGMGKGKFLIQLAKENPEINYIGIEKFSSVLIRAIEKRMELDDIPNLYFLLFDAAHINNIFSENEIARVYLNFSDPWPKERHAKRRLTSKEYLARYEKLLTQEGEVIFKTDNRHLFTFSLEQVELAGWKLHNSTYDLHHSEYVKGNVMTEYEEKFSSMGNPIHRLVAVQARK
jgi:tRNA (guanine-N7-)-methyltransferase